jgi:DNA ligase-1
MFLLRATTSFHFLRCHFHSHPLPSPKTLATTLAPPPPPLLRPRLYSSASPRGRRSTAATAAGAKSVEKKPPARPRRAEAVPPPLAAAAAGGAAMSSSGGAGGKRSVADVLMGNARDAARKAKKGPAGAPSPKKTETAAQADDAAVEPAVPEKPPSPAKSPAKAKKRSPSPTRSKTVAAPVKLEAEEKPPSPKRSKALAAKSDAKPSAETLVSQPDEKRPSSPKKAKASNATKSEEANTSLELRKKGSEFDPMAAAYWKPGEPVPFLFLARALDLISNESGRIIITEILSNVFRTIIATTPEDLLATVYLSVSRIAPPHEGIELGIGDTSIIRALSEAYGRKEEHVKKNLKVVRL